MCKSYPSRSFSRTRDGEIASVSGRFGERERERLREGEREGEGEGGHILLNIENATLPEASGKRGNQKA